MNWENMTLCNPFNSLFSMQPFSSRQINRLSRTKGCMFFLPDEALKSYSVFRFSSHLTYLYCWGVCSWWTCGRSDRTSVASHRSVPHKSARLVTEGVIWATRPDGALSREITECKSPWEIPSVPGVCFWVLTNAGEMAAVRLNARERRGMARHDENMRQNVNIQQICSQTTTVLFWSPRDFDQADKSHIKTEVHVPTGLLAHCLFPFCEAM